MDTITAVRDLLQRTEIYNVPWVQVVVAAFDYFHSTYQSFGDCQDNEQTSNLTNVAQRMQMPKRESLWILCTLSELCSGQLVEREPFLIEICLAILLNHAPKWNDNLSHDYLSPHASDIPLLEAVVTLAAMSCSRGRANRLHILTRSRKYPWLFLNFRNPALFANWFEDIPSDYHKQLISLLFLIIYAFICRGSYPLAIQYFTVITAKGDSPLYISALTAIAPAIRDSGLSAIGRMILAPQTQELTRMIHDSMPNGEHTFLEEMLKNYDLQFGTNENPDPNFFAIIFILSKHVPSDKLV